MIYHYNVGGFEFDDSTQAYFEKRLGRLNKFMRKYGQSENEDTVEIKIAVDKNRHHSGEVYESRATIFYPDHGRFHAQVSGRNVTQCADLLQDKLKAQLAKFRSKHK